MISFENLWISIGNHGTSLENLWISYEAHSIANESHCTSFENLWTSVENHWTSFENLCISDETHLISNESHCISFENLGISFENLDLKECCCYQLWWNICFWISLIWVFRFWNFKSIRSITEIYPLYERRVKTRGTRERKSSAPLNDNWLSLL